jgi:hypothetical protein
LSLILYFIYSSLIFKLKCLQNSKYLIPFIRLSKNKEFAHKPNHLKSTINEFRIEIYGHLHSNNTLFIMSTVISIIWYKIIMKIWALMNVMKFDLHNRLHFFHKQTIKIYHKSRRFMQFTTKNIENFYVCPINIKNLFCWFPKTMKQLKMKKWMRHTCIQMISSNGSLHI